MSIATIAPAELDFILQDAGGIVTFSNQSGYGILESPDLDVTDQTQFRFRGYDRILVVREGAFAGLGEDQSITYGGFPFVIRDVGNATASGLRRLAVTRGTPVDHLTVTPSPTAGFIGDTQQLVALAFDAQGNVLIGRAISWSSSNPTIATVSATGLVTYVATGSCTITVTCEGKTATDTVTTAPLLSLTLEWDLVGDPTQLAAPRIASTDNGGNPGLPLGIPLYDYQLQNHRHAVLRADGTWTQARNGDRMGSTQAVGGDPYGAVVSTNYGPGPLPGTVWARVQPPAYPGVANWNISNNQPAALDTHDQQDAATYKHSMRVALQATTVAQVGQQLRVQFLSNTTFLVVKEQIVTLTLAPQFVTMVYDSVAQFNDCKYQIQTIEAVGALRATDFLLMGWDSPASRVPDRVVEVGRRGFWHESYGALSENATQNCFWPSDDPVMQAPAAKAVTVLATPDTADYDGGNTLKQFTLPANRSGAITMTAPQKVGRFDGGATNDYYAVGQPSLPVEDIWVGLWAIEDLTGALEASLQAQGGPLYGPVAMTRDPSQLRRADGACFYRARIPVNLASEGYMNFTPFIRNATVAPIVFNGTRCFMLAEGAQGDARNAGWHDAMVPKRTITGPVWSGGAWLMTPLVAELLTRAEGFYVTRRVFPYALGSMAALGMGSRSASKRDLHQSGPFGSALLSFEGYMVPNEDGDGMTKVHLGMQNGGGSQAWSAVFKIPAGSQYFPAFTDIDIALAWKRDPNDSIVKLVGVGFGIGAGSGLQWVQNGDMIYGQPVTIAFTGGADWELANHLAYGSDRDKTGCHGGWESESFAGNTVNTATIQSQILAQIAKRWGPRVAH